jgi:hypothetical protein
VEQRIIPSTWRANGAGVFAEPRPGVSFRAYLVEGLDGLGFSAASGIRGGRQKGSRAKADDLAVVARADVESGGALRVGGSVYSGGSAQGAVDGEGRSFTARTTLVEAHAEWRRRGLQARALVARVTVDEAEMLNAAAGLTGTDSIGESLFGWYAETGYELMQHIAPHRRERLVPYVRYERYDTQDEVPTGFSADPASDRRVLTAGAAFYPHEQVVIKTDFQRMTNAAETGVDQLNVAMGFLY